MKTIKGIFTNFWITILIVYIMSSLAFGITTKEIERWEKEKAVESLITALRDESWVIRHAATQALCRIGDARAAEAMTTLLIDEVEDIRESAEKFLEKINPEWEKSEFVKKQVPVFISALKSYYIVVRQQAAKVLGKIGDARAVEPLIVAMRDKDLHTKEIIVETIGTIGGELAIKEITILLRDEVEDIRKVAEMVLTKIYPEWPKSEVVKRQVPEFISALTNNNDGVRKEAAKVLGKIGNIRAVEPLIAAVGDKNLSVREYIVEALGNIGDVRSTEPLIGLLRNENSDVRMEVIESLGKIRDARAVEPLIVAMRDKDLRTKKIIVETIGTIGGELAIKEITILLRDEVEDIRKVAEMVLTKIYPEWPKSEVVKRQVPEFISALTNNNDGVRKEAAKVLGKIGDVKAVEPLIIKMRDKDFNVRKNAAVALCTIGDVRALEVMIVSLRDEAKDIREASAEFLDKADPKWLKREVARRQVPEFISALRNNNDDVRKEAAKILGKIGGAEAVEPLIISLKDKDIYVQCYASESLNKLLEKPATLFKAGITLPFNLGWSIVPISLSLAIMIVCYIFIKGKKQIRYTGIFPAFIFWFSCFFFVCVAIRFRTGGVSIGLCYILAVLPFFYNIPGVILLLAVSGKWLRAKRQAKHFVCSRDYHRRFIIGPGLPWIVRWSRRILFVERLKQHDNFEDYFICKTCEKKDRRLVNVRKVIGLIGGDVIDYRQEGDKVYVNLWFEQEKKAQNADIDVLEIKESDGISYDYAVNAVLNVLKNDVSRPRKYVKKIPIIIKGKPPLSENSIMILKHEFGGVKYS